MAGSIKDIDKLKELEYLDNRIESSKEVLENSKNKQIVKLARQKKAEYKKKRDAVDKIYVTARKEFEEITKEDGRLAEQAKETQKNIEDTQGDYRKVNSFTEKLNEINNNRAAIDKKLEQVEANYNKIQAIRSKLDSAIENVSLKEEKAKKLYENESINAQIDYKEASEKKQSLIKDISPAAMQAYNNARKITGKIVLTELKNGSCAVCRSKLSQASLTSIKKQAPIGTCPNCHRLMIVKS